MIPADADLEYLKVHHGFAVLDLGKTLMKVDDRMQWVRVHRFSATVGGKTIRKVCEILCDKFTDEVLAAQTDVVINSLKVEILKREEEEKQNG